MATKKPATKNSVADLNKPNPGVTSMKSGPGRTLRFQYLQAVLEGVAQAQSDLKSLQKSLEDSGNDTARVNNLIGEFDDMIVELEELAV